MNYNSELYIPLYILIKNTVNQQLSYFGIRNIFTFPFSIYKKKLHYL